MVRVAKILLWSLAGLFLVVIVSIVGFTLYLRTPSGSRFVLAQAQRTLASSGTELRYTAGRIDPFTGLHFENLHVARKGPGQDLDLTVRLIDIRYRIGWLSRQVEVEIAQIDQPKVIFRAVASEVAKPAPPAPKAPNPDPLKTLREWAVSPPVKLIVRDFKLENLGVDAEMRDPETTTVAKFSDLSVRGHGDLLAGTASLWGEMQMPKPGRVLWHHEDAQGKLAAQLDAFQLGGNVHFGAKTAKLFAGDRSALEVFDGTGTWSTGAGQFHQTAAGKVAAARFASQRVTFHAGLHPDPTVEFTFRADGVYTDAALKRPIAAESTGKLTVAQDLKRLNIDATAVVDSVPLAKYHTEVTAGPALAFKVDASVHPDARLYAALKSGDSLRKLGDLEAHFGVDGKIARELPTLLHATNDYFAGTTLDADLHAELPHLKVAPMKRRQPIAFTAHAAWVFAKRELAFDGHVKVENDEAVKFGTRTSLGESDIHAHVDAQVATGAYLTNFAPAATLAKAGQWRIVAKLDVEKAKSGIKTTGQTTLTQTSPPTDPKSRVVLGEPLQVDHDVDLTGGKARAKISAQVPRLEIEKVAKVAGSKFRLDVDTPSLDRPKDLNVVAEMHQGEIVLAPEMAKGAPPLTGLQATLRAHVHGGDELKVEVLSVDFNRAMVRLAAEASGRLARKEFQMRGMFSVEVPKNFPAVAGQTFRGRIECPWMISVLHGTEINLEGHADLQNLSWSKGAQYVRGVTGRIPLEEKLVLVGQSVKFAYLITQNPFERVDYERLRPLIDRSDQLRIEEIGFEEKKYGPMIGYFAARQNILFGHQFDFTIGKTGQAYGEMYFDMYPRNLQMGFLARLTKLDLADVLPKKFLAHTPTGDQNLSGRSGIVINLNKGSVDGRVDVTEIGASQLITMINVLDPKYENEKMNMMRTALGVGYPTFMQMALQKGYLDLGVDIRALGLSQRFDVRSIPISTWVAAATSGIVKKTEEGPLK